ncbi:hypothetical protein TWF718_010877 [Orbilia javanica]|uniref:Uncharacterized protein n=1 Tax=Orbilia javanica TaxID=47235 RepID=A0AAN8MIB5_9PEZI
MSQSGHSHLLACPPEIHLEILGHLKRIPDQTPLRNFSCVSKTCRDRAIPFLFTSLWLNPESVAAFRDGGAFSHFRPSVRTLYVSNRESPNGEFIEILPFIELLSSPAKPLHLFPHATNISVVNFTCPDHLTPGNYHTPSSARNNLFVALWREISAFKGFKNITVSSPISLPHTVFRERGFVDSPFETVLSNLSPGAREFLGPVQVLATELGGGTVLLPPQNFETIKISTNRLVLQRRPGLTSGLLFFVNSGETLKSLEIDLNKFYIINWPNEDCGTLMFPNVTRIRLKSKTWTGASCAQLLYWFATHCPNTESLMLHIYRRYTFGLSHIEYRALAGLSKLVNLELPWPHEARGIYTKTQLSHFIREMIASGLGNLENITFGKSGRGDNPSMYIFQECRVDRSDKMNDVKIWFKGRYCYSTATKQFLHRSQTEFEEVEGSNEDDLNDVFAL